MINQKERRRIEVKFPEGFHVQAGLRIPVRIKVNLASAEEGCEAGFVENIKVREDKAVFSIIKTNKY